MHEAGLADERRKLVPGVCPHSERELAGGAAGKIDALVLAQQTGPFVEGGRYRTVVPSLQVAKRGRAREAPSGDTT